jgi:two-component system, LytTR family, response regulator
MNQFNTALRVAAPHQPGPVPAETQPKYLQRFVVKLDARVFAVAVDQVDWIESAANYVRLHVGANNYLLRGTMTVVEASLDPHQFMRVHRNAIVNLARVQEYHMPTRGSMHVLLRNGSRVPLSRGYQPAVRKLLQEGGGPRVLAATGTTGHPMS